MNKKKIFLWLSPFLLFALYWLGIYWSLRNPMEEINYAENGSWMRYVMFRPFTETIGSDRIWKEDEGFQMYPYSDDIVGGQEDLSVMMFRDSSEWVYWHEYHLNENASIRMSFKYNSKKEHWFKKKCIFTRIIKQLKEVIFYRNLLPTAKTLLGFETKARRSPNNTSLVPGSRMEARAILWKIWAICQSSTMNW